MNSPTPDQIEKARQRIIANALLELEGEADDLNPGSTKEGRISPSTSPSSRLKLALAAGAAAAAIAIAFLVSSPWDISPDGDDPGILEADNQSGWSPAYASKNARFDARDGGLVLRDGWIVLSNRGSDYSVPDLDDEGLKVRIERGSAVVMHKDHQTPLDQRVDSLIDDLNSAGALDAIGERTLRDMNNWKHLKKVSICLLAGSALINGVAAQAMDTEEAAEKADHEAMTDEEKGNYFDKKIKPFDANQDGEIAFDEFVNIDFPDDVAETMPEVIESFRQVREAMFDDYDADGSGAFDRAEFVESYDPNKVYKADDEGEGEAPPKPEKTVKREKVVEKESTKRVTGKSSVETKKTEKKVKTVEKEKTTESKGSATTKGEKKVTKETKSTKRSTSKSSEDAKATHHAAHEALKDARHRAAEVERSVADARDELEKARAELENAEEVLAKARQRLREAREEAEKSGTKEAKDEAREAEEVTERAEDELEGARDAAEDAEKKSCEWDAELEEIREVLKRAEEKAEEAVRRREIEREAANEANEAKEAKEAKEAREESRRRSTEKEAAKGR